MDEKGQGKIMVAVGVSIELHGRIDKVQTGSTCT